MKEGKEVKEGSEGREVKEGSEGREVNEVKEGRKRRKRSSIRLLCTVSWRRVRKEGKEGKEE